MNITLNLQLINNIFFDAHFSIFSIMYEQCFVRFEPGSPGYDTYPKSKRNNDEMIDLRRNQEDLQLR